jgi:hypothetical protein
MLKSDRDQLRRVVVVVVVAGLLLLVVVVVEEEDDEDDDDEDDAPRRAMLRAVDEFIFGWCSCSFLFLLESGVTTRFARPDNRRNFLLGTAGETDSSSSSCSDSLWDSTGDNKEL